MGPDAMNWPARRTLAAGYAVAIASLVLNAILTFWNLSTVRTAWDTLAAGRDFVRGIDSVLSDRKDAETGQRGYLLTGDERYPRALREVAYHHPHLDRPPPIARWRQRQPPRTLERRRGGIRRQASRAGTGYRCPQAQWLRGRHRSNADRPRQAGYGSSPR